jgi:hypothetical protein
MTFTPTMIKPCRNSKLSPQLKKAKVIRSANNGRETSVIFDLNILSKMREVINGEISYKNSGLISLVKELNGLGPICLSPGFALKEASSSISIEIVNSFEMFLDTYCKSFEDHPGATKNYDELKSNSSSFAELDKEEQLAHSLTYIGILKIQQIEKLQSDLSPIEKFDEYLSYMSSKANVIGMVEAEAAKYVFSDISQIKDAKIRVINRKIKANFRKGGDSHQKLLERCLNSARDISYYRLTAYQSDVVIDGKAQESWLVTADEGLMHLTNSMYFVPVKGQPKAKHVTYVRDKEQRKNKYWLACDNALDKLVNQRKVLGNCFDDSTLKNILDCINDLEKELLKVY